MNFATRSYRHVLLSLIALNLVYCSHGIEDQKKEGGQDGGGGQVHASTLEEVRETVDLAFRLGSETNLSRNIFVRFWLESVFDANQGNETSYSDIVKKFEANPNTIGQLIETPKHLFPNLDPDRDLFTNPNPDRPNSVLNMTTPSVSERPTVIPKKVGGKVFRAAWKVDLEKFRSPLLEALATNSRIYKETGDCAQPEKKHADASVSSHTKNASICFSLGNLSRLTPNSLLGAILSLLLHETSHMGGAQEAEAQVWQRLFSNYYSAKFSALDRAGLIAKQTETYARANTYLDVAFQINDQLPGDGRVYLFLGKFLQTLTSMPYYLDPLMLQIALKPPHPELVNNYSNSVLALIQKTRKRFSLGDFVRTKDPQILVLNPTMIDMTAKLNESIKKQTIKPEVIARTINDLHGDLWTVGENFKAYIGDTVAKSVCVLPIEPLLPNEDYMDQALPSFFNKHIFDERLRLSAPARECSPILSNRQ